MSCSAAKRPTQTDPKSPLLAITRLSRGAGASPDTCTVCGPTGSSLKMVMSADLGPVPDGSNRIGMSIASPTSSSIGYERTLGGRKSGEDDVMLLIDSMP